MNAQQRAIYDSIVSTRGGWFHGPYDPMLHQPRLAEPAQQLGKFLRYDTSLPPRLSEMGILLTARHWDCKMEWYQHVSIAARAGLAELTIEAIRRGQEPQSMAEDEAILFHFVQSLLRDHRIRDLCYERARLAFGVVGVVELTALIGYYSFIAFSLNAHEIGLPEGVPPGLADTLTEYETSVPTADGVMPTIVVHPRESRPSPAVILFMDAPGIRPELVTMAHRIAARGYCCFLPDSYYRYGRIRLDLTHRTEAHAAVYRLLASSLVNAAVAADTARLLIAVRANEAVREGPVGCVGFSCGGRFAIHAAGTFPAQIRAAVSVCGTGLVTEAADSPHGLLANSDAELLFEFAERDAAVGPEVVPTLERVLAGTRVVHQIYTEPGTQHGYSFPLRPMYHAPAAENTWRRTFELLDRTLLP
jgi:dienelactone hydrolase/alkylhydroperoxidase family enzyme